MSVIDAITAPTQARGRLRSEIFMAAGMLFGRWVHSFRTRRQLQNLSDAALADIGLTREAANREVRRPFWDSTVVLDRRGS